MSTENNKPAPKNLEQLADKGKAFVTKHARTYFHKTKSYDLTKIDQVTAEALANDPSCRFLQWADGEKRPKNQVAPLPTSSSSESSAARVPTK